MSSNASTSNNNGIGLGGILFVVFLVLKLTDKIDWSWWWVTSPLWIPAAIVATIFAVGLFFVGLAAALGR